MFAISPSITPLVLSVLALYPWLLALGVWQLGTRLAKGRTECQANVRTVQVVAHESGAWTIGGAGSAQNVSSPAFLEGASRFPLPKAITLPVGFDQRVPLPESPSEFPSAPRAPPAFS